MRALAVGLFLSLFCGCAFAQGPATGFPPFGSFQNGSFDSTDLQNLNTFFQIPIVGSPGRGMNFSFAITYNTAMWSNTGYLGAWTPLTNINGANWGWNLIPSLGFFPFYANDTGCWYDHETEWGSYTTYSEFAYTDPQGTNHTFNGINYTVVGDGGSNCHVTTGGTQKAYADDNSGLYMDATQSILYALDPTVMTTDGTQNSGLQIKDTNGNYYTSHFINMSETDWIDSVGRVALKVITSSSSIQYEYYDPTGAYQTTTVNLASVPVKTNFACFGITEFSGTVSLPTSVVLPNGQSYSMTYESTPGYSGYYTGRLLKITLPTGGYYEYDYPTTGNLGLSCTDGSITNLTRKVNAATPNWTYARTSISGAAGTTTVTTPIMPWDTVANQIVYTFNSNGQETSEKYFQGSSTLLRTINSTWATNGSPATQVTILEDGSTQSEVDTTYDSHQNLTQVKEYDWGSGAHGSLIRTTNNSYLATSSYIALNIANRLTEKTISDGGGTIRYRNDIAYDGATLSSTTGAPGHDDSNYGTANNIRGNATSVIFYSDPVTPGGATTKNFTYDTLGNLQTELVNSVLQKQINYSSGSAYFAPTSVVRGPSGGPQLTVSTTYNAYTGQIASATDENGQVTSFSYDILKRPINVTRPDTTQLTTCFSDLSSSPCYSASGLYNISTIPTDSTHSTKQITNFDTLGRPTIVTLEDGAGIVYSNVQTSYDPMSRAYKTSNPYTGSPAYWTESDFDGLGRLVKTILPDGAQSTVSYSLNCETTVDPASKSRKLCSDGGGRMEKVYEDPSGLNYETDYTENVLNQLTQVSQGSQTRTYNYNGNGQLTSFSIPESASNYTYFQYNGFGLLTQRTDARGVITGYSYDALNRPYQVTYNVGSTGVASPGTITYSFGSSSTSNNNGRLISISDGSGSESYSYDLLGRITELAKVINSVTYPIYYTYNLGNELTQINYPSGRVVKQSLDTLGRPCAVGANGSTCSSGTTYASGLTYSAAQQITGYTLGNGVVANLGYSANRLQLTSLSYVKSGVTLFGLSYGYGSVNNGQIASVTDNVDNGRTASYTYDSLYRLATASTSGDSTYPRWGLSMTYDRYGNRTGQTVTAGTAPANSLTVLTGSNHISGSGFNYDANGNMTGDGVNTLTFDVENRAISTTGTSGSGTYGYDAHGLRVKKSAGGTNTVYVFLGSQVIAEYDNGAGIASPSREYIYIGHKLISTITSAGTLYHANDHLSVRATTNSSGAVVGQQGHFPFGEQWYASSTTTKWFFTSYERDSESGNDYARSRSYVNRLGRFSSLDPLPGTRSNPQSMNRYSYVRNDPINAVDHMGTCADDSIGYSDKLFLHFPKHYIAVRTSADDSIGYSDKPFIHFHKHDVATRSSSDSDGGSVQQDDDWDDYDPCDGNPDAGGGGSGGDGLIDPSVPPPPPGYACMGVPLICGDWSVLPDAGLGDPPPPIFDVELGFSADGNSRVEDSPSQNSPDDDQSESLDDTGGCTDGSIFCQMRRDCAECGKIFNGADHFTKLATGFVGVGVLGAIAAPAIATAAPAVAYTLGTGWDVTTTFVRGVAQDPAFIGFAGDFIDGFAPGAIPLTWGAFAGLTAGDLINNSSQVWRTVTQTNYLWIMGPVMVETPH